ncbi:XRE family transcriptional regulator [Hymenobacter aquaticus]|uniref:XRE family transcriptional regulator n=1 Tax=Hymenobacter aquaticus TaxID=1867101 RepID=A0A4Z0Q3U8_9BACT|nr:XRE family transcriptional regulator [Hymenobacter aquaticus]
MLIHFLLPMVERIRTLLQARQLSPTQFADAIGVARPIVSHILSGRNKPSLEVVQKVIGAFPDLSLPWLLSGIGPMIANSGPVAPAVTAEAPLPTKASAGQEAPVKRPRTAPAAPASPAPGSKAVEPAPPPAESEPELLPAPARTNPTEYTPPPTPIPAAAAVAQTGGQSAQAPAGLDTSVLAFAEPGKKIRRIVIFYQDGTFADYQPE